MLPTSQTQTAFFLRETIIQKLSRELAAILDPFVVVHVQNTRAAHYNNMHITLYYICLSRKINAFFFDPTSARGCAAVCRLTWRMNIL